MSIQCRLSVLMGEKRYKIKNVHEKTGLARTAISSLHHHRMEKVDYETLNKVCDLFEYGVCDILEYKKD